MPTAMAEAREALPVPWLWHMQRWLLHCSDNCRKTHPCTEPMVGASPVGGTPVGCLTMQRTTFRYPNHGVHPCWVPHRCKAPLFKRFLELCGIDIGCIVGHTWALSQGFIIILISIEVRGANIFVFSVHAHTPDTRDKKTVVEYL